MRGDLVRLKERLEARASALKAETYALYLAARHPDTPWYARAVVVATVAYALSPIDLIPDFIPVLGYLDDLIIVPAGLALAVRLTPAHVVSECRVRAADELRPTTAAGRWAAAVVVLIWVVLLAWAAWSLLRIYPRA
jgi:uncharacterized membrane protein YkvA (DUF1232 family)